MSTTTTSRPLGPTIIRGAVGGMVAGAAMAMFAMLASVTYQHHGFFTPLFHISALIGSPDAMMRSVMEAMDGNRFWFDAGPAALGLLIHMMTGAMFGICFVMLARRVPGAQLVGAGALYGLAVYVVSAFVALPLAAKVTDSGDAISDMASMVGHATFAVEHVLFGVVLGVMTLRARSTEARSATTTDPRSAMLAG